MKEKYFAKFQMELTNIEMVSRDDFSKEEDIGCNFCGGDITKKMFTALTNSQFLEIDITEQLLICSRCFNKIRKDKIIKL